MGDPESYTDAPMAGALQDLYETRTARDRDGNVRDEWNRVLLRRDLDRLIAEGQIKPVDWLQAALSFGG